MSTNHLSAILDQENNFKNIKSKQRPNDENVRTNSKRQAAPISTQADKRTRIPLGGKDLNTVIPTLQRSKSSLQSGQQPLQATRLRQQGPSLPRQPLLQKSNSSLGFTPRSSIANTKSERSRGSKLPPDEASREKELVPRFATDELKKSTYTPLPPLGTSLRETLSENTAQLHAKHVPMAGRSGDPKKRNKGQLAHEAEHEQLLDQLAEEGIDTVSQQDVPVPEYVPFDVPKLREEDLEFLRTGARPVTAFKEWSDSENESDDDDMDNLALQKDLEAQGPVGLSTEELNDMLDF